MSICSDIWISKEEARERVKKQILAEQERLIELAVNAMKDYELTGYLHSDMYFYHIEKKEKRNG